MVIGYCSTSRWDYLGRPTPTCFAQTDPFRVPNGFPPYRQIFEVAFAFSDQLQQTAHELAARALRKAAVDHGY
jgi:hypothetical protein